MPQAIFLYNGKNFTISCQIKDKLKDLFNKFKIKSNIKDKNIIFIYNREKIEDENRTIGELTTSPEFTILVYDFENPPINKNDTSKVSEVLCPECKSCAILTSKDFQLNITCCENNHYFNDILINKFSKTQKIKLLCNNCKSENMSSIEDNIFFRCYTCSINLCQRCKDIHKNNNNHIIINYNERNYICKNHNDYYIIYCKTCKKNLCLKCKESHIEHELILYDKIVIENDYIMKGLKEIRKEIDIFKNNIDEKIKMFNEIKENIEEYYTIINGIINYYIKDGKRNYEILKNIKEIIGNNNIINEIKKINKNNKYNDIIEIYNKMNKNDNAIIYKINDNNKKIRLFGKNFVKNNKNIIKLEIEDKEYDLMEYYDIKNSNCINNNNKLEVKIKGIEKLTDMGYMFNMCTSLLSFSVISKWNTINVIDMGHMFYECSSLISLPDISKWNTNNVTDMDGMFYGCSSLISLPDISKWNTNQVTDMGFIFRECSSLLSLPDLSKWDISNVNYMGYMFYGCSSLSSLPNISKWNTNNVTDMGYMFCDCSSLTTLPDISKWNINNVTDMGGMFYGCSSLSSLPNISKWNINNYTIDTEFINFENLPDISNWDLNNENDMGNIFYGCLSLVKIPGKFKY